MGNTISRIIVRRSARTPGDHTIGTGGKKKRGGRSLRTVVGVEADTKIEKHHRSQTFTNSSSTQPSVGVKLEKLKLGY